MVRQLPIEKLEHPIALIWRRKDGNLILHLLLGHIDFLFDEPALRLLRGSAQMKHRRSIGCIAARHGQHCAIQKSNLIEMNYRDVKGCEVAMQSSHGFGGDYRRQAQSLVREGALRLE